MDRRYRGILWAAGGAGKRVTLSLPAEREGDRKAARAKLAKRMVDDLLRAGPAAVRTALQTDKTLVSFLDASAFARLADYARSCHPPAAKLKPGVDVLKVMNANPWHWRIAEGLFQVLVIIIMATAIVWPTWRGLLHLATD